MKKIIILILCLAGVSAMAQDRYVSSLDIVGGAGFGHGPQVVFAPQYVGQYDFGGFRLGAGVGLRYARPCYEIVTKNGIQSKNYCNELNIPAFVRLGFGKEKLFANIDAGYSIGVVALFGKEVVSKTDTHYDGLFVEPQIGMRLGECGGLALGVLLQQGNVGTRVVTSDSESNTTNFQLKKEFTPAITLRYAFFF